MVVEPGRPPVSLLALVVENVMAEVAVYRPLNRWVEGEAGGTVEEQQCSHMDQKKTAPLGSGPPSHKPRDMAVDSLLFELLVASPAHDLVGVVAAERLLRQQRTVECFCQECPLYH